MGHKLRALLSVAAVFGLMGSLDCGSGQAAQYRHADIEEAIGKLSQPDKYDRKHFVYVLGTMKDEAKDAIPALIKLLQTDPEDDVCGEAANTLSKIGSSAEPAIPVLIVFLQSNREGIERSYAASALGDIGKQSEKCVPILIESLADESDYVRRDAARALGSFHDKAQSAIPALIKAIKEGDKDFREAAAYGLADIPARAGDVPALAGLLSDEVDCARLAAANSLEGAGSEAVVAVPALIKLLTDRDDHLRIAAARTLGSIGPEAKEAIPALKKAQDDNEIAELATDALKKIKGRH